MDNRTYGATRECRGCRHWSEMMAKAGGGLPGVHAMCLSPSSVHQGEYTSGSTSCQAWESGHLGAVDEPGEDPERYREEAPSYG